MKESKALFMFNNYCVMVDNRLSEILKPYECEYKELLDAMYYSVSAGGKRIRPVLLLEFTKLSGGNPTDALEFACALEMIHTYSLIHDDLPCMDNDDFRRGRPSCHKAFNEATALLAGDALLTDAFKVALSTKNISSDKIVKATAVLSECAGTKGMIGGQVIDLKYENSKMPLEAIKAMYLMKTGALLVAAAKIGCILGGADEEQIIAAEKFAKNIGLAFQIKDDILDVLGTYESLGKPIGSDEASSKSTYVTYVGLESAQNDVEQITNDALNALDVFSTDTNNIKDFARKLCIRNN